MGVSDTLSATPFPSCSSSASGFSAVVVPAIEEDVDPADVELPPPMKIQDHSFTSVTASLTAVQETTVSDSGTDCLLVGTSSEGTPSARQTGDNTFAVPNNGSSHCDTEDDARPELDEEQEKNLLKRNYVMQELVETERDYVRDLGLVVDGYMQVMRGDDMPMPEDLSSGKDKIIFGNIEAIYEWHRE